MATPSVLTFDTEGRAVDFEVWIDDLQLFLQCDRADGLSLFDLTSGASPAPPADADSTVRSQWATRDAAACLVVRRHLPTAELMDHFFSVCPTTLTVDLLEERLLAAEKRIIAVGASRGDPRTPVFEGCSPSPLLPSVASAAAADLVGFESVGAASAPSGRRRTVRARGARGVGGAGGGGGVGGGGSGGGGGGGGSGGGSGGVGGSSGGGGGGGGGGGSGGGGGGGGGGGNGEAGHGFGQRSGSGGGPRQQQQRSRETVSPQQLCEWYAGRQRGGGTSPCTYVLRTGDRAGIEAAALGAGEAAALGASASAAPGAGESALSGTTSAQALHTFTLDSGASRSFFRDRTTLTTLSRPVAVSLADPSGGPVLATFSAVFPCPAAPSGTLLSFGTTALVTPPCLISEAWPPVSLSLVSPGPSLPYLRGVM
ncbi:unnamed protein product [Closterium sp. NIES-65]|nr:unnamed protein product [Closterium sp. NIES-65]